MTTHFSTKKFILWSMFFLAILGITGYKAYKSYLRDNPNKVHCKDFDTQPEAQEAYDNGAIDLDGYDKDKRACENLPLIKPQKTIRL